MYRPDWKLSWRWVRATFAVYALAAIGSGLGFLVFATLSLLLQEGVGIMFSRVAYLMLGVYFMM